MALWSPNVTGRRGPVYRAIADAIDRDVQNGVLRPGARLPPHRALADHLGVTVTTVTRAYTEAARRGLTDGHVGRGTFIRGCETDDDSTTQMAINLGINILVPDNEIARLEPHLFQRRAIPWTQILGYVPPKGHVRHRQAMSEWLDLVGLSAHPDHIALTAGAQHGLAVSFLALLNPGDTLLVEGLTYSGVHVLAQQTHVTLRGVAMDAEGLSPAALAAACRATRARVLYCMPRLQNPTSAVMSERRRREIAAVVEQYRLTVIEDDVYGFLSPERTPLAALIPDRTVFLTSTSKALFPGMRLGCVVAVPSLLERISASIWSTMVMTSPLGADLLAGWMEDGTVTRIMDWKRREVRARQAIARRVLPKEQVRTHPCSPHAWLSLPPRWSSAAFVAYVRARGVALNAASSFVVGEPEPRAVRLCLGAPRTRASLEQALRIVVEALAARAPLANTV